MKDKTNDIVERATTLFMQHGVHSVSMQDVASYCGISKKTLYWNFQSKEKLVEIVVQKVIWKTDKFIRVCPGISPNAVKEIENFSKHILDVLGILTPKFISDLKKYYLMQYAQLIVFRDNSIMPYIERCLERGITEENFKPDLNKRNTGQQYCWQISNTLEGNTLRENVTKIIENANDLFLQDILNSKGLKLLNTNKQKENTGQNGIRELDDQC